MERRELQRGREIGLEIEMEREREKDRNYTEFPRAFS